MKFLCHSTKINCTAPSCMSWLATNRKVRTAKKKQLLYFKLHGCNWHSIFLIFRGYLASDRSKYRGQNSDSKVLLYGHACSVQLVLLWYQSRLSKEPHSNRKPLTWKSWAFRLLAMGSAESLGLQWKFSYANFILTGVSYRILTLVYIRSCLKMISSTAKAWKPDYVMHTWVCACVGGWLCSCLCSPKKKSYIVSVVYVPPSSRFRNDRFPRYFLLTISF